MADSRFDINNILQAGSFSTSRGKSPQQQQPSVDHSTSSAQLRGERETPLTSSRYGPTDVGDAVTVRERRQPLVSRTRSAAGTSAKRRPPPPSIEDDDDEGSFPNEEAKSRGDVDQLPVIIDMIEYFENTERKFVLVSQTTDGSSQDEKESPEATDEASRKHKSGSNDPSAETPSAGLKSPPIPNLQRRKSNKDLPKLSTEANSGTYRDGPSPSGRSRSRSKNKTYHDHDYFSQRRASQKTRDDGGLLSPDIIKQGTRDREEMYVNYGSGGGSRRQNGPATKLERRPSTDKRYASAAKDGSDSASPTVERRPPRGERDLRRWSREREQSFSKNNRSPSRERTSYSPRRRSAVAGERRSSQSPGPRQRQRKSPSPPVAGTSRQDRDKLSRRQSSRKKRESPERKNVDYSSGEEDVPRKPALGRRRAPSIITQDDKGLLSPGGPRTLASQSRSRSKNNNASPLPSPSYADHIAQQGLRPSATMPIKRNEGSSAPYPEDDNLKPGLTSRRSFRDPRARSHEPSIMPAMPPVATALPIPIPAPAGPRDMMDRRRSALLGYDYPDPLSLAMPPPPVPHSWQPSPPKSSWQPAPFVPENMYMKPDRPVGIYRRFSEDTTRGGLPPIPACPRREGVASMSDWLTLPHCNNFNICPNCFTAVFVNGPYRSQFAAMPWRPRDKKIACDFGSTPWYRIAYLLTLKNKIPDLRLFNAIDSVETDVAGKSQDCSGNRSVKRLWFSIWDPATGRAIPDFDVCYECAKTVESLLPNLRGVLTNKGAEATRGTCSMHFTLERKRFTMLFDALEVASDSALATGSPPDIAALAADIDSLVSVPECREDTPLANTKWYIMEGLPELTVCQECYQDVVEPQQPPQGRKGGGGSDQNSVAGSFYRKKLSSPNSCQMYSQRMRDVFASACRTENVSMLTDVVLERRKIQNRVQNQLAKLDQDPRTAASSQAMDELIQYWRKWE